MYNENIAMHVDKLVFPPVQRTGEQRFFVVLTNYYSEHTIKYKHIM